MDVLRDRIVPSCRLIVKTQSSRHTVKTHPITISTKVGVGVPYYACGATGGHPRDTQPNINGYFWATAEVRSLARASAWLVEKVV